MNRRAPKYALLFLILMLFANCAGKNKKKQEKELEIPATTQDTTVITKKCATMQVLEQKMVKHPEYRKTMEKIESFCRAYEKLIRSKKITDSLTLTIPVVVHVIYSNDQENISDEQIQSQIAVLNADFNKKNTDFDQVPEVFSKLVADIGIDFELKKTNRVASERKKWGTNDEMKFSENGGADAVSPDTHLNIWVCTIGSSILGYAQFPGLGEAETDGIVISPQFFGNIGTVTAPFNKGRTASHEVGHWLNLRHIWGDGDCSRDDFVEDTPLTDRPNNGCPEFPVVHCDSDDMSMNYMDYTNDACMYMFTNGQKERIHSIFAEGGPRERFLTP